MSAQNSREVGDVKILLKTGVDGNGIADIEKTGTVDNVDTYTITMDDGAKYTFTVTNGTSIASISKTGTVDNVDTYTITLTDGSEFFFYVTNGTGVALLPHLIITAGAGQTVTATKGTTVITTEETSSGVYEGDVTDYGTWTVSDGSNTVTVDVDTVKEYNITLSSVPEGSTVTPTDDISIWLACGQRSETYTTLAEVLADSTCLSALMADSNAVDYLVRSKSFIGNDALVPTMTSNTTPSGEASASAYNTNREAYHAFDGNSSNYWGSTTSSNQWVQYDFGTAKIVTSVSIKALYATQIRLKNFKIQGSNDGSTFTDIYTGVYPNDTSEPLETYTFTNSTAYRYWRLLAVDTYGDNISVKTLQFGFSGITQSSSAMTYIGLNNYASNTLLADSDWCAAICNSEYFESVLNVKVPTMTGYTTPSGEVIYSSTNTTDPAWKAFDGSAIPQDTGLFANGNGYIGYVFPNSVKVYMAKIMPHASYHSVNYTVQGSSDGTTWNDRSQAQSITAGSWNTIINTSTEDSRYWRVNGSGTAPSANYMNEAQFYGREDV